MNMKLIAAGACTAIGLTAFCGVQISNVKASQRSKDTGSVDITFDLSSDSNRVSVVLSALNSDNNQTVAMHAVYDDEGNFLGNPAKIEPGDGRHLVWNSALDLGKGFYSSSMVVTVRATEGDLPLSVTELHEVTKSNCIQARAQAKVALADAEAKLAEAQANQATVSDAALQAAVTNLQAQQTAIVKGNDAWLAISNMYGIATKAWFDSNGFRMAREDQYHDYDWNRTLKLNSDSYYVSTFTGVTNKYNTAVAYVVAATAPVSTNRYVIWVNGEAVGTTKYGSVNAAAYIAQQYAAVAHGSRIEIQAYTNSVFVELYDVDRSVVVAAGNFTKELVNKYEAFAALDKAAFAKAEKAKTDATTALNDAIAAMKAIFDKDAETINAYNDATANYSNRKSLQATAELAVRNAEDAVKSAKASYDKAQMACDSLGL